MIHQPERHRHIQRHIRHELQRRRRTRDVGLIRCPAPNVPVVAWRVVLGDRWDLANVVLEVEADGT
jgi:hypothetical protein